MKKLILILCLSLVYLTSFSVNNPIKQVFYNDGCIKTEISQFNENTYKIINYYENSNIQEIKYYDLNKNKTGLWESYNENGIKISEASFKNNKKHGFWKFWDTNNGKLTMVMEYKNGKRIKAFMYNEKEGLIASINL